MLGHVASLSLVLGKILQASPSNGGRKCATYVEGSALVDLGFEYSGGIIESLAGCIYQGPRVAKD